MLSFERFTHFGMYLQNQITWQWKHIQITAYRKYSNIAAKIVTFTGLSRVFFYPFRDTMHTDTQRKQVNARVYHSFFLSSYTCTVHTSIVDAQIDKRKVWFSSYTHTHTFLFIISAPSANSVFWCDFLIFERSINTHFFFMPPFFSLKASKLVLLAMLLPIFFFFLMLFVWIACFASPFVLPFRVFDSTKTKTTVYYYCCWIAWRKAKNERMYV